MTEVPMTCSLKSCGKDLLGMCVLIKDEYHAGLSDEQYDSYNTMEEGGQINRLFILHPVCWEQVFDELMAQEQMTAIMVIVGGVADIRAGLSIP